MKARALVKAAVVLVVGVYPLALPADLDAAEGSVRIGEATLDALAAEVLPLSFSAPVPPLLWCGSSASLELDRLTFRVRPGTFIDVDGHLSGSWCGLHTEVTVSFLARVFYDARERAARVQFVPTPTTVSVRLPDWFRLLALIHFVLLPETVSFPFFVDLNPYLGSIPPIPLEATVLTVQTPRGPRQLALVGRNVQVLNQDGYIEVRGSVELY